MLREKPIPWQLHSCNDIGRRTSKSSQKIKPRINDALFVEWCWQAKTEMLVENPVLVLLHWWKGIGRVKPKYSEENLFHWYFVYHNPLRGPDCDGKHLSSGRFCRITAQNKALASVLYCTQVFINVFVTIFTHFWRSNSASLLNFAKNLSQKRISFFALQPSFCEYVRKITRWMSHLLI